MVRVSIISNAVTSRVLVMLKHTQNKMYKNSQIEFNKRLQSKFYSIFINNHSCFTFRSRLEEIG